MRFNNHCEREELFSRQLFKYTEAPTGCTKGCYRDSPVVLVKENQRDLFLIATYKKKIRLILSCIFNDNWRTNIQITSLQSEQDDYKPEYTIRINNKTSTVPKTEARQLTRNQERKSLFGEGFLKGHWFCSFFRNFRPLTEKLLV